MSKDNFSFIDEIQNSLKCIQCDGSGAIQVSEDDVEQCQFCYEIRFPFIEQSTKQLIQGFKAAMLEVIGNKEYYRNHYNFVVTEKEHIEIREKLARDELRHELRQALETLVNSKGEHKPHKRNGEVV